MEQSAVYIPTQNGELISVPPIALATSFNTSFKASTYFVRPTPRNCKWAWPFCKVRIPLLLPCDMIKYVWVLFILFPTAQGSINLVCVHERKRRNRFPNPNGCGCTSPGRTSKTGSMAFARASGAYRAVGW